MEDQGFKTSKYQIQVRQLATFMITECSWRILSSLQKYQLLTFYLQEDPVCYHHYMALLLMFILGVVVGSFLNVVSDRLPKGQSIIYPPSHCPHCRHRLAWYDLLPVVSYLFLQGKCRYCKERISFYYPAVEILTGLVFVLVYIFAMPMGYVYTIYLLFILSILIIIFFTDYKFGIIPVYCVIIGCMIVITYLVYTLSIQTILYHVLSAVGAFTFFFILFAATKGRGMGFGDVMLVLLLGLFLGFPNIAIALYISFLLGAFISVLLIVTGIKKLKHDTIPFGPFLILGTCAALFAGRDIIQLVMSYML